MNQKTFTRAAGVIFSLIFVLHVFRIVYQWDAMIGGWAVPMWLSWLALAISGFLAFQGLRLSKTLA